LALISHLDLLRLLERAMRRADLPVSFSAGFHPLPRLQVALALTLGVEADGEWMDIDFRQVVDPDQTRMALQAQLSPGLKLEEACRVPVTGAGLSQLLRTARWRWTQLAPGPIAVPRWDAAIDALMEAHTLVWSDTDKKGRSRCRDGRPLLRHLRRCSNARGGNASRLPSNSPGADDCDPRP